MYFTRLDDSPMFRKQVSRLTDSLDLGSWRLGESRLVVGTLGRWVSGERQKLAASGVMPGSWWHQGWAPGDCLDPSSSWGCAGGNGWRKPDPSRCSFASSHLKSRFEIEPQLCLALRPW